MTVSRILMVDVWSRLTAFALALLLFGWYFSLWSPQQETTFLGYLSIAALSVLLWKRISTIQFILRNGTVFPGEVVSVHWRRHSRMYEFTYGSKDKKKNSGSSRLIVFPAFKKNDKIKVIWHELYPNMPLILNAYKQK